MNNVASIINKMTIQKRADGRFEGRITFNSKRKGFYGKTKGEVKQKAKEFLTKVENGFRDPEKISLNCYIQYWLTTYKKNKIELSSYSRLCVVFDSQIKETIGKKMIGDVSSRDIQELIDEYANPSTSEGKALSISGLKKIIQLLNPCFKMAIEEGIIFKNPCNLVILPKETNIKKETKKQISLTDDETQRFKEACLEKNKTNKEYKSRDALILLIILNLGLRVGEMLALDWSDVDFNQGLIYIRKTLQSNLLDYDFNEGIKRLPNKVRNAPKTSAGIRILNLNEKVEFYFKELLEYDKRNHIKAKFIACTRVGTRNTPRNLQRSLDRVVKRANINQEVSLHTLRHTFGSYLIRHGIGIEVISKLMGHANNMITYNKYIHSIKEEEAKAMKLLKVC